ncbi:ABC transporter substrate-binding protein [Stella sp.]|uniref:ABC transporter substrate-binding protein n=1 Tax=Stella sp. TaxID=2912054 RepID=UPI0035B048A0
MTRLATLLSVLALALAPAAQAQTAAPALQKLDVLLDWYVNPDHAPLVVTLERGYFREAGLDVRLIAPSDPNDPPKLVAAGKAEIAVSYQPHLHIQTSQGLPLTRIGTLVATPLNTLMVLDSSPIRSIADLKGRTVGFAVAGTEDATMGAMLARHGLTVADIKLINVGFGLTAALASGRVDAIIGAYRNFELTQLDLIGKKGRPFYVEEEGVPPYDELILVAQRGRLGNLPLRAFVDAVERGTQYLVNHPEASWKLFLARHKELDDELNRRAWRDTLPRFALRPGALDRARYQRFAEFLRERGVIKSVLPIDEYAIEVPYRR